MATKRVHRMSDMPKEGFFNKKNEALLSPPESEIESHIAACADQQYVLDLQKDVGYMLEASKAKLRGQSLKSRAASRPSVDSHPRKSLKDMTPAELQQTMRRTSGELFGAFAPPLHLLQYLHGYDPNVLTDQEMDRVKSTTLLGADEPGATQMYDMMQKYESWLPCTMDVLRDGHVDLEEFAEMLQLRVGLEKATNAILENPDNAGRLSNLLINKLAMVLKPLEILHLFHKYDPNVLVQEDIDVVAELTMEEGNVVGSEELLDRLIQYPGWYSCLMLVLKDSSVGLSDLADELADLIAEEFQEIKQLQQYAEEELTARVARIKERSKEAKKKKKKKPKTPKAESTDFDDTLSDLGSQAPAPKMKKSRAWKKILMAKNRMPKYPGIDWNRELGPHALDHLPTDVETADQRAKFIEDAKKKDCVPAPGLHDRMLDPWAEGEKYAEKYALAELFTFMLTRLILDTPGKPIDYLINLTREINRLNMARKQVDQLSEGKKKCEMEAARKKSSVDATDTEEKASTGLQDEQTEAHNSQADAAEDENEMAKDSESAKLVEYTDGSEYTEGTEVDNGPEN